MNKKENFVKITLLTQEIGLIYVMYWIPAKKLVAINFALEVTFLPINTNSHGFLQFDWF